MKGHKGQLNYPSRQVSWSERILNQMLTKFGRKHLEQRHRFTKRRANASEQITFKIFRSASLASPGAASFGASSATAAAFGSPRLRDMLSFFSLNINPPLLIKDQFRTSVPSEILSSDISYRLNETLLCVIMKDSINETWQCPHSVFSPGKNSKSRP